MDETFHIIKYSCDEMLNLNGRTKYRINYNIRTESCFLFEEHHEKIHESIMNKFQKVENKFWAFTDVMIKSKYIKDVFSLPKCLVSLMISTSEFVCFKFYC